MGVIINDYSMQISVPPVRGIDLRNKQEGYKWVRKRMCKEKDVQGKGYDAENFN